MGVQTIKGRPVLPLGWKIGVDLITGGLTASSYYTTYYPSLAHDGSESSRFLGNTGDTLPWLQCLNLIPSNSVVFYLSSEIGSQTVLAFDFYGDGELLFKGVNPSTQAGSYYCFRTKKRWTTTRLQVTQSSGATTTINEIALYQATQRPTERIDRKSLLTLPSVSRL